MFKCMISDYWMLVLTVTLLVLAAGLLVFIPYKYGVRGKYLFTLPVILLVLLLVGGNLSLMIVGICLGSFWLSKRSKK